MFPKLAKKAKLFCFDTYSNSEGVPPSVMESYSTIFC